jgi:hypothetical protein
MKKTIGIISIILLIGLNICFIPNALATVELQVSFTTNPIVVSPGGNGYIELILKNTGSETVKYIDIETEILDSSVIKYQGNWDVHIGSLGWGESTNSIYEFSIPTTANPGLYQVIFETVSSAWDTKVTAFIRVEDSSVLDLVSVSPSSINIGEVRTLTFNISNNGGSSTGNILFTWEDPNDLILPVGSDNRITVSSIPAGNYTEIPVNVVASPAISPGVYPLTITMEFYDRTGTKQTITSEVGIQVNGTTDFEIILQESMGVGTTFAVANSGANVASSVIVSIPSQLNYMVSGASSVSLGNLDAGDYTLATFQISSADWENNTQRPDKSFMERPSDFNFSRPEGFRGSESGINDLIVEVSYTDLFGVRQTVEKEVDFSSFSSSNLAFRSGGKSGLRPDESSGLDSGTMYIIIGVVGIIVIVSILKIGKRKKK